MVYALSKSWRQQPPVFVAVSALAGYKPPAKPKKGDEAVEELMSLFQQQPR